MHLVRRGVITDPEHVFHLGYREVTDGISGDHSTRVVERIGEFARHRELRIPQAWAGSPEVTRAMEVRAKPLVPGGMITGVAASGGRIEGVARVVGDPTVVELDDGDILVCETTDPSWVSLFLVAGAVVTDFGGMLSHGPIVARELGIPCVCGTATGSRRIADGSLIRVDGDTGEVTVLA
ncbi:PEP-utilizing enzyme [Gordonia sp. NPDC003376]